MNLTKHWAALLDDYVIDLAWSPDGSRLAAASTAGAISIFDAAGAKLHELPGHEDGANCIAWAPAPHASLLASGGQDGKVKFWDALAGQHTATAALGGAGRAVSPKPPQTSSDERGGFGETALPKSSGSGGAWVEHIAWRPAVFWSAVAEGASATGDTALSDSQSSPDAPQAKRCRRFALPPHSKVAPDADCAPVLAAAAGRELVFLNADASVRHRNAPAAKTISALAWQPAGGCLAAAYFGGVELWDSDDFVLQKKFAYNNGIHALIWSPDNRWLVSGNQDTSVHLWIPETDVELHMSGYESKVTSLAFDRESRWLATGGGQAACVWNCSGAAGPEGREPDQLPHPAKVCALAFQRGRGHAGAGAHDMLASASEDGSVMLWSLEHSQPLRATVKMPSPATRLAWSPDDRLLAIGSEKGAVYVLRCAE